MSEPDTTGPRPLPRIDALVGYSRAVRPATIDLLLDGNEGALPPAEILGAIASDGAEIVRSYPDTSALEADLTAQLPFEIAAERVLVTAGADEGLDRIFRAFLDPRRNYVLPEPSFEMLPRYGEMVGAECRSVPWLRGDYPIVRVLDRVDDDTAVIFVVSPNNPTGLCATSADVEQLARAAPHAVIVVDAAYAEFAAEDLTGDALAFDNVLVTRTLSKAWGMAGLRIGYVLGAADIIATLRKAGSPYAVAGPSIAIARAWLARGTPSVAAFIETVGNERDQLVAQLSAHGCEVWPSQANFVLTRSSRSPEIVAALADSGIAVRTFGSREHLTDCIRITLPGEADGFRRLTTSLDAVLNAGAEPAGDTP